MTITVDGSGNIIVSGQHTFTAAGLAYPAVTLAYGGASASTTAKAITIDVSAECHSKSRASAPRPTTQNLITKLTTSTLTVTNTGKTSLNGEFYLVLQGLTPGVTLQTATITVGNTTYSLTIDKTAAGDPMIVIPQSVMSQLAAGNSLTRSALSFQQPVQRVDQGQYQTVFRPL